MSILEARCTCQGEAFFGTYEIELEGGNETVRVRFNGDEVVGDTRGFPAAAIASTLLGELVTRRIRAGTIRTPLAHSAHGTPEDLVKRLRRTRKDNGGR